VDTVRREPRALVARVRADGVWAVDGVVAVDGLTVLLWTVVTFFSGIVHSYSRRYVAGSAHETKFFVGTFGFTLVVMGLVAADHIALFAALWLAMGLAMAELIGTVDGWKQARTAASVARRYFLASSALLGVALTALWLATDETTISGIAAAADGLSGPLWLAAAVALVLAAMIQSALVPFHGWLLSSMTAPTPASALMHAGFVNGGGNPVDAVCPGRDRRRDAHARDRGRRRDERVRREANKNRSGRRQRRTRLLDDRTDGVYDYAGGARFFGAAVTHLILHGFYKAYHFLSAGERIAHRSPTADEPDGTTLAGVAVVALSGLAGGALFAVLTGKGTSADSGLLLAVFITLTTLHAASSVVARASLSTPARYGAIPLVALPAIAVYALVYEAVVGVLAGLPVIAAPTELSALHGLVAVAFVAVYVAMEAGVHERSRRLYVALLNAGRPAPNTVVTATEEYDER